MGMITIHPTAVKASLHYIADSEPERQDDHALIDEYYQAYCEEIAVRAESAGFEVYMGVGSTTYEWEVENEAEEEYMLYEMPDFWQWLMG